MTAERIDDGGVPPVGDANRTNKLYLEPVDDSVAASPPTTDGYTTAIMGDWVPRFQVHLNDAALQTRRRFTLTHELAHIWLDHVLAGEALADDQAEGEANFLAY